MSGGKHYSKVSKAEGASDGDGLQEPEEWCRKAEKAFAVGHERTWSLSNKSRELQGESLKEGTGGVTKGDSVRQGDGCKSPP